ncbi:MAG TPA: glycosyltransferase, partial [Chitinophagaceae bacterium]|nr:glycosyltransferase [Chitinophagaceae bacterium]
MKILFVVPRFHTNQYQMVKTLQQKNHTVYFHVASIGLTEDHSLVTPVKYSQSKASKLLESISGNASVNHPNYFPNPIYYWRRFKELKPDIVIIRDPYKPFALLAALCSSFAKSKIIFYTQEALGGSGSRRKAVKQNLLVHFFKAAWMVPIMENRNGDLKKLKHQYYVPLPVPCNTWQNIETAAADDEPKILMIGKYHQARKNHLLFINAIKALKDKYRFKVTMVGECVRQQQLEKFEHIKTTIQQMELSDIIMLKQNIPYHKMTALYTSHQIFVLPAINEQYGISVTEALGFGLPVICTDTCGARFNIVNGENGFVVKSNSLTSLTTALEMVLSNDAKRQDMS